MPRRHGTSTSTTCCSIFALALSLAVVPPLPALAAGGQEVIVQQAGGAAAAAAAADPYAALFDRYLAPGDSSAVDRQRRDVHGLYRSFEYDDDLAWDDMYGNDYLDDYMAKEIPRKKNAIVRPIEKEPADKKQKDNNKAGKAVTGRPGAPQEKPGAPQEKPGAPQEKPGAAQEKPGAPQDKPGAPQDKPGAPQDKPGASKPQAPGAKIREEKKKRQNGGGGGRSCNQLGDCLQRCLTRPENKESANKAHTQKAKPAVVDSKSKKKHDYSEDYASPMVRTHNKMYGGGKPPPAPKPEPKMPAQPPKLHKPDEKPEIPILPESEEEEEEPAPTTPKPKETPAPAKPEYKKPEPKPEPEKPKEMNKPEPVEPEVPVDIPEEPELKKPEPKPEPKKPKVGGYGGDYADEDDIFNLQDYALDDYDGFDDAFDDGWPAYGAERVQGRHRRRYSASDEDVFPALGY